MAAEENFLSTPSGYATPNQIAALREYAKALMQPSKIRPLAHYMPAVADAVKGLMGGYGLYRAGEREKESADYTGAMQTRGLEGSQNPPTSPSGRPQGVSEGGASTPAPGPAVSPSALGYAPQGGGTPNPLDPATHAPRLGGFESGNDYAKLGPIINNRGMYQGDRAYGKYQVMGKNIPEWTAAALGRPMTPQEFLASPEAQEAVFKHRFGSYLKQTGSPQDAASMWFTGRPLAQAQAAGARDQLGTTVDKYVRSTVGGTSPLAFAGTPNVDPGMPTTALAAAARGAPAGPRSGVPTGPVTTPMPSAAGIPGMMFPVPVPPGVLNRVAPPPEVMRHLLGAGAGYANPAVTNTLANLFLQRNQPQQLEAPGGKILVPPGSSTGYYVPTVQKLEPPQVGDIKPPPSYVIYNPTTRQFEEVPVGGGPGTPTGIPTPPSGSPDTTPPAGLVPGGTPAQPRPPATPPQQQTATPPPEPPPQQTAAPAPPPATPPAAGTPPAAPAPASQAPGDLELPSFGTTTAPQGGIVQYAPEGGQGAFPPSLLNIFPPTETNMGRPASPEQEQEPVAYTSGQGGQQIAQAPQPPAARPQVAQAAGSTLSPRNQAAISELMEIDKQRKGALEHQQQDVKQYGETTKNLYNVGQAARTIKQLINLGLEHIQEGRAFQGRSAGVKQEYAGWAADIAPLLGFPEHGQRMSDRVASTQLLEKSVAGGILNDLKIMLQGLGQIRVAEIDLMNKSTANMYSQPTANKALFDLGLRAADIAQDLSTMTAWYDRGARVDATGKLIVGPDGRPQLFAGRPTTEGLQRTLQVVYDNHPRKLTTEQLRIEQDKIFGPAKGPVKTYENRAQQPQQPQQTPQRGRGVPTQQRTEQPTRPSLDTFMR